MFVGRVIVDKPVFLFMLVLQELRSVMLSMHFRGLVRTLIDFFEVILREGGGVQFDSFIRRDLMS